MDVPAFPAPPALVSRSVSLDDRDSSIPGSGLTLASARRELACRRRPRSASWLVARKQTRRRSRRSNHVQPILAAAAVAAGEGTVVTRPARSRELSTRVTLTMTETRYAEDEEDGGDGGGGRRHGGVEEEMEEELDRIREDRTSSRTIKEDQVDEADIICCASAEANKDTRHTALGAVTTATIPERLSPIHLEDQEEEDEEDERLEEEAARKSRNCVVAAVPSAPVKRQQAQLRSTGAQTTDRVLYRLRVFPTLKDIVDEETKPPDPKKRGSRIFRYFRFLGRVALCQFGLAWLLTLWAVLGAGAFYVTEGPRERQQVVELKDMQRDLAVGLATELRQLRADDKETEPLWSAKVRQYVARHEKLLLIAVSSGYGEGGDNGQLWTFSGCMLFAISVITTLGFGAPVPRTNAGRTVAVIFAAIGIPAHFLLVLNLGLLLAIRLKKYGIAKQYPNECRDPDTVDTLPMPMWLKILPFFVIAVYYVAGILCFGVGRRRPFSDSLLFPLDFTAAGGLSTIAGYVRILYGLYLEGAVILTAIAVAVLKLSATQSLTNIGLKYGLLIRA